MPYLRGMFRCVVSEWHGIDRHRIDKFYSLLSKGIDTGIRNLKPSGEDVPLAGLDAKAVKELMDMLTEEVFDTCERNGKGVTLHCLDKWIDHVVTEVLTSVDEDNEKEVAALYTVVMDPLFRSLRVNDVAIPKRAMETTKELLERWETALDQGISIPLKTQKALNTRFFFCDRGDHRRCDRSIRRFMDDSGRLIYVFLVRMLWLDFSFYLFR